MEKTENIRVLRSDKQLLGQALIAEGLIREEDALALDEQRVTGEPLGKILIRLHLIRSDAFERLQANRMGISAWNREEDPPDHSLLQHFPAELMVKYHAFPVRVVDRQDPHVGAAAGPPLFDRLCCIVEPS